MTDDLHDRMDAALDHLLSGTGLLAMTGPIGVFARKFAPMAKSKLSEAPETEIRAMASLLRGCADHILDGSPLPTADE